MTDHWLQRLLKYNVHILFKKTRLRIFEILSADPTTFRCLQTINQATPVLRMLIAFHTAES